MYYMAGPLLKSRRRPCIHSRTVSVEWCLQWADWWRSHNAYSVHVWNWCTTYSSGLLRTRLRALLWTHDSRSL